MANEIEASRTLSAQPEIPRQGRVLRHEAFLRTVCMLGVYVFGALCLVSIFALGTFAFISGLLAGIFLALLLILLALFHLGRRRRPTESSRAR